MPIIGFSTKELIDFMLNADIHISLAKFTQIAEEIQRRALESLQASEILLKKDSE